MLRRLSLLFSVLLMIVPDASGAAHLIIQRGGNLFCPSSTTGRLLLNLFNPLDTVQTIPAGTTVTYTLSVPIVTLFTPPTGAIGSVSGNTLIVKIAREIDIPPRMGFQIQIEVSPKGLIDGGLVTNRVSVEPPTAIVFSDSTSKVAAIADQRSCQTAATGAITIDDLNTTCPTSAEIRKFDADLTITFDGDPTAGMLVCRASDGSADLTRLQERTYQALRLMQTVPFDSALPWTNKPLYEWLTSAIRGIHFTSDTIYSFCCNPANVINVQTNNLATSQLFTPDVLVGLVALFVHEARHNQGFTHTCGNSDQTITELGAWSAQYFLQEWIVFKTGQFFVPSTTFH